MRGKSYSYPQFKWYQFIQKRRWNKAMSRLSVGERIKMRTSAIPSRTFTDDFEVQAWIKLSDTSQNTNK